MTVKERVHEAEARWHAAYKGGDVSASLKAVQDRLAIAREAQRSEPAGHRLAVGETFYLFGYALTPEGRIATYRQTRIKQENGSKVIADQRLAVEFPNTASGYREASAWSLRENAAQFEAAGTKS